MDDSYLLSSKLPAPDGGQDVAPPQERDGLLSDYFGPDALMRNAPDFNPQEYAQREHAFGVAQGRPVEEHARMLEARGFAPETIQQLTNQYKLGLEKEKLRGTVPGGTPGQVARMLPWATDLFDLKGHNSYAEARKKFQGGDTSPAILQEMAKYERLEEIDRDMASSTPTAIIQAMGQVPKMFLEAAGAGKALSLAAPKIGALVGHGYAGATKRFLAGETRATTRATALANRELAKAAPQMDRVQRVLRMAEQNWATSAGRMAFLLPAMPSMWVDEARQRNIVENRDADDWRGYPGSVMYGYLNLLVLNRIQRMVPGATRPTHALKAGAAGVAEQQMVDVAGGLWDAVMPEILDTRSNFGVMKHLVDGDFGEAGHRLAVQFATFSMFGALQDPGKITSARVKMVDDTKLFGKELLDRRDEIAREKGISKKQAMQEAIQEANEAAELAAKALIETHNAETGKSEEKPPEGPAPQPATPEPTQPSGPTGVQPQGPSRADLIKEIQNEANNRAEDVYNRALQDARDRGLKKAAAEAEADQVTQEWYDAFVAQKTAELDAQPTAQSGTSQPTVGQPTAQPAQPTGPATTIQAPAETPTIAPEARSPVDPGQDLSGPPIAQPDASQGPKTGDTGAAVGLEGPPPPQVTPLPRPASDIDPRLGFVRLTPEEQEKATQIGQEIDAANLPPMTKMLYKKAFAEALIAMNPSARATALASIQGTRWYKTNKEVGVGVHEQMLANPRISEALREEYLEKIEAIKSGKWSTMGGIDANGVLHLNGKPELATVGMAGRYGTATPDLHFVYMHELGHLVDHGMGDPASIPGGEWQKIRVAEFHPKPGDELPPLTNYAIAHKDLGVLNRESFAEFFRIVHDPRIPTTQIAKDFPRATEFFKRNNLWPAERAPGLGGPRRINYQDVFTNRLGDPKGPAHVDARRVPDRAVDDRDADELLEKQYEQAAHEYEMRLKNLPAEELEKRIEAADLTDRQKEVLYLYFKEGLDYGEIAERLGYKGESGPREVAAAAMLKLNKGLPAAKRGKRGQTLAQATAGVDEANKQRVYDQEYQKQLRLGVADNIARENAEAFADNWARYQREGVYDETAPTEQADSLKAGQEGGGSAARVLYSQIEKLNEKYAAAKTDAQREEITRQILDATNRLGEIEGGFRGMQGRPDDGKDLSGPRLMMIEREPLTEDQERMMRAIQEDPLDPTKRLVLADAIEESGTPNAANRAALVRRDVRNPPDDTGIADWGQLSWQQQYEIEQTPEFKRIYNDIVSRRGHENRKHTRDYWDDMNLALERYFNERSLAGEQFVTRPRDDYQFHMNMHMLSEFAPRVYQQTSPQNALDLVDPMGLPAGRLVLGNHITTDRRGTPFGYDGPRGAVVEFSSYHTGFQSAEPNPPLIGRNNRGIIDGTLIEHGGTNENLRNAVLSIMLKKSELNRLHYDSIYGQVLERMKEVGWKEVELDKDRVRLDSPLRQRMREEQALGFRTGEAMFMEMAREPLTDEQRSLMKAVHDNPEDMSLRLILADAIEESGTPNAAKRAALVRSYVEKPAGIRGVATEPEMAIDDYRRMIEDPRWVQIRREIREKTGGTDYYELTRTAANQWMGERELAGDRFEGTQRLPFELLPGEQIGYNSPIGTLSPRLFQQDLVTDLLDVALGRVVPWQDFHTKSPRNWESYRETGVIEYMTEPDYSDATQTHYQVPYTHQIRGGIDGDITVNMPDESGYMGQQILSITLRPREWHETRIKELTERGWKKIDLGDGKARLDSPLRQKLREDQALGFRTGEARFMEGPVQAQGPAQGPAPSQKGWFGRMFDSLRGKNWVKPFKAALHGQLPDRAVEELLTKNATVRGYAKAAGDAINDLTTVVGGDWRAVPRDAIEQMNEALQNPDAMKTLAPSLQAPLSAMRDMINSLSQHLIDIGAISEKLQPKILEGMGTYLSRQYQVFIDPDWHKKVRPEVVNTFKAFLRDELAREGRTLTEAEADGLVAELLKNETAHENPIAFIAGRVLGDKDLGILFKRKDIPEPLRALWGEVKDPVANFANTIGRMAHLASNHIFQGNVRDIGLSEGWFSRTPIAGKTDIQLAKPGDRSMGALQELYTTLPIKKAFESVYKPEELPNYLRAYMGVLGATKYAKTVLSPVSHLRQILGNVLFVTRNGYSAADLKAAQGHIREMLKGSKDGRNYHRRLIELNLDDNSVLGGEFRDVANDVLGVQSPFDLSIHVGIGSKNRIRRLLDFAQEAYRYEDLLPKIVGFEGEKAALRKAHPDWSPDQIDVEASRIVQSLFPTYSRIGPGIRWLRRFPITGPFVSFASEMIRTTYNLGKQIGSELRDKNPEVQKMGARRLAGSIASMAGLAAIGGLSRYLAGITIDEEDAIRQQLPEWNRDGNLLHLGKDKEGRYRIIDLGRTDPHSFLLEPFQAGLTTVRSGSSRDIFSILQPAIQPFIGEEIGTRAFLDIARNRKENSRSPVYNPEDTLIGKASDIVAHGLKAVEPGLVDQLVRTGKAGTGIINSKTGKEYDLGNELLADTTGQRVIEVDPKENLRYKTIAFNERMRSAEGAANIVRSQMERSGRALAGPIEDSELAGPYAEGERMRLKVFGDFLDDIRAARLTGLDEPQIAQILRQGGVSKEDVGLLLGGQYRERSISDFQRKR